jgi:hypothetical protein
VSNLTFCFDSYELSAPDKLGFRYSYRDDKHETIADFEESYTLPDGLQLDISDDDLKYILQQLHIIIGISYYKSLLGPVELPYALSDPEAAYWNTVYDKGLGEYAYINQITEPITPFRPSPESTPRAAVERPTAADALLGIGGGKDSIVAGEIFKAVGLDTVTFAVASGNHHGQAGEVMETMDLPQLRVERYVDRSIVEFTKKHGGNNGHIPLSALLAWLGVLLAYAKSRKYIVMANEAAASIGNVTWNGHEVNHQWSKSLEFETLTQDFIHQHVATDLFYFSPLRPYGSLAVISLFTKLGDEYLEDFTSCNLVLRIDPRQRPNGRWCTRCAKCLSTWLLLSASLPIEQTERIFGKNMFDDISLRPLLQELVGLQGHKPLDCVGTVEELRAVTREALKTYPRAPLLDGLVAVAIPGPDINTLVNATGPDRMPQELRDRLKDSVATTLATA